MILGGYLKGFEDLIEVIVMMVIWVFNNYVEGFFDVEFVMDWEEVFK